MGAAAKKAAALLSRHRPDVDAIADAIRRAAAQMPPEGTPALKRWLHNWRSRRGLSPNEEPMWHGRVRVRPIVANDCGARRFGHVDPVGPHHHTKQVRK